MAAIQLVAVAAALGSDIDMSLVALVGTGVVFVVIGNYLPKVRPNYMMGIRTPWTLTSDLSWDRTHRLGGRLFVLEGIVFILLGLRAAAGGGIRGRAHRRDRADAGVLLRVLVPGLEDRPAAASRHDRHADPAPRSCRSSLIELGLIIFALRDLLKPERRVRGESKLMWGLIIVFISLFGPILYLVVGRQEE